MFLRLGLIGAPRSGKSLIGNYLTSAKKFKQFAFADQIKKEYFLNSKYSEDDFEWAKRYNKDLENIIRDSLWEYSNIKKKENNELFFINPVIQSIKSYKGNVIITDIRTKEELFELEKIGTKFVVISRLEVGDVLSGTKIPHVLIEKYKMFNNWSDSVEELYGNFERFFKEEFMDAEEDSYNL